MAAIIAARSAHELGVNEREVFLDHAEGAEELDQARLTTLRRSPSVSQERYEEALAVLNDLPRAARNPRLLRLKPQAEQALRHWDAVLDTLDAPRSWAAWARGAARSGAAHLGQPGRKSQDAAALTTYWKQIPSAVRMDPTVAATAARHYLALGLQAKRRRSSSRRWNANGTRASSRSTARRVRATRCRRSSAPKWLRTHARDPALLLALGKLCMRQRFPGQGAELHRGEPRPRATQTAT